MYYYFFYFHGSDGGTRESEVRHCVAVAKENGTVMNMGTIGE